MKSANEMMAATDSHEDWIPLLEMSAREVFELMLGCKLSLSAAEGNNALNVTAMVGLAGQLCGC